MRSTELQIPYPEQYIRFFELFNEREYFESHEELEDLWIMETGPEKNYYKGLIMVTIALEHWRRKNPGGAWRLWRDGDRLLEVYPDYLMGFELGVFRKTIRELMSVIIDSKGKKLSPCEVGKHPVLSLDKRAD